MLKPFGRYCARFISRHIVEERERAVYTSEPDSGAWFCEVDSIVEPPFENVGSHYEALYRQYLYANKAFRRSGFGVRVIETITLSAFGVQIRQMRTIVWERKVR